MASERTFIAIKPDGVQRGLVGKIIKRFEQRGYKLVAMKLCRPGKEHLEKHYEDLKGKVRLYFWHFHNQTFNPGILQQTHRVHELWPNLRHGLGGQKRRQNGPYDARRDQPTGLSSR